MLDRQRFAGGFERGDGERMHLPAGRGGRAEDSHAARPANARWPCARGDLSSSAARFANRAPSVAGQVELQRP